MELIGNPNVIEMEYAVRGPIPRRAAELKKEGRQTILCNIGNPQALGQKPMTYYRQVLGLLEDPTKVARERKLRELLGGAGKDASGVELLSDHVLDVADRILGRLGA